jgi:hypothetical protein
MGGAKAHYDGIVAFSQTDFTEDLKKTSVPVLVMPGDDDQIVPYAVGGTSQAARPSGRDARTGRTTPSLVHGPTVAKASRSASQACTVNGVSKVTDANGVACFDGLPFDTYTVHETVPAGYHGEADKQVTVDNTATCAGNPFGGETVSFHNTPLTNITTSVDSQVDGGTSSTITCVDSGNNTVASGSTGTNGDGSATASNLEPGTYTCTVVVDP